MLQHFSRSTLYTFWPTQCPSFKMPKLRLHFNFGRFLTPRHRKRDNWIVLRHILHKLSPNPRRYITRWQPYTASYTWHTVSKQNPQSWCEPVPIVIENTIQASLSALLITRRIDISLLDWTAEICVWTRPTTCWSCTCWWYTWVDSSYIAPSVLIK